MTAGLLFRARIAPAISPTKTVEGLIGGVVMSAIKRDRGVKDWGTLSQDVEGC